MPTFFDFSKFLVKVLFKLLTRRRVTGRENVPAEGPVMIVANHLSNLDPPLVGIFIDRKVMYMAKEQLFSRKMLFLGPALRNFGAFPIHKSRTDLDALLKGKQRLKEGHPLMIFPEGKRSKDRRLHAPLDGPALIATLANAPILPVGITGTENSREIWWLKRPVLTVTFGKPFHLPPVTGKLTREELAERSDYIMRRIAELLPPEYRGEYSGEGVSKTHSKPELRGPEITGPSATR